MTSTVNLDPPTLHAELEAGRQRAERRNPACPRCGRRNAEAFFKPREQNRSFRCECGEVFKPK